MNRQFLMGNEAIGLGAIRAGVNVVSGYPGTPSTEILETIAKHNDGSIYVEWSVNEKAGMEVAAGAAYSGARALVTMKQVGLNVASDPLMCLAYMGVKGGMVIVVADDPGPISSQTEQDTRHFAHYSKLPIFDPSSPEEAYLMIGDAFDYSEKYGTPVIFRPTTRVCHGSAAIDITEPVYNKKPEGFIKDTSRWVIFPKLSYNNHLKIEKRNPELGKVFSEYRFNRINISNTGKDHKDSSKTGIVTGGISYEYVMEALSLINVPASIPLMKIATPYPFPEELALKFLDSVDEILVVEELDPVLERELIYICGKYNLKKTIKGKLTGDISFAGENSVESVKTAVCSWLDIPCTKSQLPAPPDLPVRPPVLCAGCPHRASFYAVKCAMKGIKSIFAGDIGCYTLGNSKPLDMVDTCLCMGADVTVAQGLKRTNPDSVCFSFIGDSTFFASGMTGVVNAVYNETDIVLIVLDNSTTAMTGHQPHPGTGITMMGNVVDKVSIEKILTAMGVKSVETVNPLDLKASVSAVKKAAGVKGVSAVIFKSPCIAVTKPEKPCVIDDSKCIKCHKCINEIGCPAIVLEDEKIKIEPSLCFGCNLCSQICPTGAIGGGKNE